MAGKLNQITQEITVHVPHDLWRHLPSNTDEFDELTLDEEGALRSLLADIWLTPGLEDVLEELGA